MSPRADDAAPSPATREQVLAYLRAHPRFLHDHPEVLESLVPPAQDHGGNVVDMQHFMLGNLQKNIRSMRDKYEGLIIASRDNMSTQAQVHSAVLSLVRARGLEQFLTIITQDLLHWFDVDVVRLALESESAGFYETYYNEQNYSGISFVSPGVVDELFASGKPVVLMDQCKTRLPPQVKDGLDQIFADCADLIHSCALLRLELEDVERSAVLAFGVRHAGHFQPGQGTELLSFLARIVEHRLDQCLSELDPA